MNRAAKISAVTQIGRLWDAILVILGPACAKSVRSHTDSAWGVGGGGVAPAPAFINFNLNTQP